MTTATAAPQDFFTRLGVDLAERVNPIVVKEIRQGLRTKSFWVFFTLMLSACVLISLITYAIADGGEKSTGQGAFIAYYVVLSIVQFFVIPYTAYRSMAREREEETWVLLTLTGLGPRRILAGKVGSFVVQGLLYSSAAAPFLVFSYFLNGIDLPTIGVALLSGSAQQVFLTSVAVCAATLAESRIARGLLHFLVLGFLFYGLVSGSTVALAFGELSRKSGGLWLVSGASMFFMVTTALLVFEAAAARLSLATEGYARGPRLAFLLQSAGIVGFALLFAISASERDAVVVGAVVLAVYAGTVGAFVGTDRATMTSSQWAKGGRYSLLRPGAFRAFAFLALTLLAGTAVLLAAGLLGASGGSFNLRQFFSLTTPAAYVVLFLSLATVMSARIPQAPAQFPILTRLLYLGGVMVASAGPPLVGGIGGEPTLVALNIVNPVVGTFLVVDGSSSAPLLWGVAWVGALLMGFGAFTALRARDVRPA